MLRPTGVRMDIHRSTGLRWLAFLLGAFLAPALHAQSPQPAENPNLELVGGGVVHAVAKQPDGGLIVGGFFPLCSCAALQYRALQCRRHA